MADQKVSEIDVFADYTDGELVELYAQYRDQIDALKARHMTELQKPETMLEKLSSELARRIAVAGSTGIPTPIGTFSVKTSQFYSVSDPAKWAEFFFEQKDLSFLGKSVMKDAVKSYEKEHGDLPPGIGCFQKQTTTFKRNK